MNKAVIYARFSTNKQREESIEGQVRVCSEMAISKELNICHVYADRGESGRSDERTEFQVMMKDAESGLFDFIICYKNDRFARNRYDAIMYKHKLKKIGVTVLFAAEPQVDGPEGVILESMLEGFAEYYSASLAVNVRRGMKENALNNQYNGGPVPIGYQITEKKQYAIDEATAPIVYEVFKRYAAGQTINNIFEYLNSLGFKTVNGKDFSKGSICSMLNNEKYIGEYVYKSSKDDIIKNPCGIPPIISRDLWDKVKERQQTQRKNAGHGKYLYLFTGKLFCGCGGQMHGCGSRSSIVDKPYRYYRCSERAKDYKKACPTIDAHVIEKIIIETIFNQVLTMENINKIADGVEKKENQKENFNRGISYIDQKKEIEEKINNLMTAIEAGIITPTTKKRLEELERQKTILEFECEKEIIKAPAFDKDKFVNFLLSIKSGNIEDRLFLKDIVNILIKKITLLKRGKVEVILQMGGGVFVTLNITYKSNGSYTVESSVN